MSALRRLAAILLWASLVAAPAFPAEWDRLTREQALAETRNPQVEKRRLAFARLAEVGTMDDVPVVLAALWDEEELVRGMAEQVVWGIWMRADDPVLDPMFQTGVRLLVEDEPRQAIEKFDEVILIKPGFAEAWNRRGDAWARLEEADRALADYGHALELNPYHFGALESCGRIWLERGEYRAAAGYFRRALDLNPNLLEVALA
ncbi:MAG TPA: tetratricopeptide repeat protein, partial [Burkholderiales bacterium]|nr:tetratricopeptide repeat protein [Burkholderiales bacterium]